MNKNTPPSIKEEEFVLVTRLGQKVFILRERTYKLKEVLVQMIDGIAG